MSNTNKAIAVFLLGIFVVCGLGFAAAVPDQETAPNPRIETTNDTQTPTNCTMTDTTDTTTEEYNPRITPADRVLVVGPDSTTVRRVGSNDPMEDSA